MWRASLRQRVAILIATLLMAYLFTLYKVAPGPADGYVEIEVGTPWDDERFAENLARFIVARHGYELAANSLTLVKVGAPGLFGHEVIGWFDAVVEGQSDVFSVKARLSPKGVPLSVDVPNNVTGTPQGDEHVLGIEDGQVGFGVSLDRRLVAVSVLNFSRSDAPGTHRPMDGVTQALRAQHDYGEWEGPAHMQAVLTPPSILDRAVLKNGVLGLQVEGADLELNLRTGQSSNPTRLKVMPEVLFGSERTSTLSDVLRRNRLVGQSALKSLWIIWSNATDRLRAQRHRIAPTGADKVGVGERGTRPTVSRLWPPAKVPVTARRRLPGEGEWTAAVNFESEASPSVVTTFLRTDPTRPYERVHLFAMDSRRLGLGFAAGTVHPKSTTGIRGTGLIPPERRRLTAAIFGGGPKAEIAPGGVVEGGRPISPPQVGLATIAMDKDGKAVFGLWDADEQLIPWESIRQTLPPLIEGGRVRLDEAARWSGAASGLEGIHTQRSALGMLSTGALLYAWSESSTAKAIAEAMLRAGCEFAVHLDVGEGATGLTLFPSGPDAPSVSGVASMGGQGAVAHQPSPRDFFYLFRGSRVSQFLREWAHIADWHIRQKLEGVPVVAEGSLDIGGSAVTALVFDGLRLRPHVVPGFAEQRPAGRRAVENVTLPSVPLAWIGIGLRPRSSPAGLTVERQVWKRPQKGLMTLVVGAGGDTLVGAYGAQPVENTVRWSTLLQGPSLVLKGGSGDAAHGRSGVPLVGFGLIDDGLLVFAVSEDGDRPALASALTTLGVRDALLLGEQGSADTGATRFFFERSGDLVMATGGVGALSAASAAPGAASALVFTARVPLPATEVVQTFVP